MYEFLNYLDAKMETPASYGPFHLAAFLVFAAAYGINKAFRKKKTA